MKIIDASEFLRNQKNYFDRSKEERIFVRQDAEYFELVPRGEEEPRHPSPSLDPFWDHACNVIELERRIATLADRQMEKCAVLEPDEDVESFINKLCTD
ncbi:MAG: hypothetical protein RR202_07865 [Bacteroidales bacterium]